MMHRSAKLRIILSIAAFSHLAAAVTSAVHLEIVMAAVAWVRRDRARWKSRL